MSVFVRHGLYLKCVLDEFPIERNCSLALRIAQEAVHFASDVLALGGQLQHKSKVITNEDEICTHCMYCCLCSTRELARAYQPGVDQRPAAQTEPREAYDVQQRARNA